MIRAFLRFMKGLGRMPAYVKLWLLMLVLVNLVIPLFYLAREAAVMTIIIFAVNALLMVLLTARAGFSRLLGAGHFPWFILIVYLAASHWEFPPTTFFNWWILTVITLDSISLIIDVGDTWKWLSGDRSEIVSGLD